MTPAHSAEDRLHALRTTYFDLVITDFRMNRKTGLDLVKETRDHGVSVPFILVTAERDAASRSMAEAMGVAAVLNRPIRKQLPVGPCRPWSLGFQPPAELRERCTAKCSFSVGGFCSISVRNPQ